MADTQDAEDLSVQDYINDVGGMLKKLFDDLGESLKNNIATGLKDAFSGLKEDIKDTVEEAAEDSQKVTKKYKSQTGASTRQKLYAQREEKELYGIGKEGVAAKKEEKDNKRQAEQNQRQLERAKRLQRAKDEYQKAKEGGSKSDAVVGLAKAGLKSFAGNVGEGLRNVGNNIKEGFTKTLAKMDGQITSTIKAYANYQGKIEARLQGVGSIVAKGNSKYDRIVDDLGQIAFSPLLKAEDLYKNLNDMIDAGIVSNVEQRALLQTMKDNIISTFDANSPTLRKLIRVQQEDSTAARLGMESYLNRFLNEFVESTEYLTSTFDRVADSLFEASALMGSREASEFEFIVQKWLGTLTGVGLSDETATAIAKAIGDLGSGNVSNVGSNGIANLLIMAANKAGQKDYAKMLAEGVTAADVNALMSGLVQYVQELSNSSSSNVVRNQLAQTFGLQVSDLVSVSNLDGSDIAAIAKEAMSMNDMYQELSTQFDLLNPRTGRIGIGQMITNAVGNLMYQTGMSVAANPLLNALWQITDITEKATGGINIPAVFGLGTGVDLEVTVERLMKMGIAGAGLVGQIGGVVNAIGSVAKGSTLLDALNVNAGNTAVSRGTGLSAYSQTPLGANKRQSGLTTSMDTYIGNENGSDYAESTINQAKDSTQNDLRHAQEEAASPENDATAKYLSDMQFRDKMDDIRNDVRDLKSNGITVKNMVSVADITNGIVGWTTKIGNEGEIG